MFSNYSFSKPHNSPPLVGGVIWTNKIYVLSKYPKHIDLPYKYRAISLCFYNEYNWWRLRGVGKTNLSLKLNIHDTTVDGDNENNDGESGADEDTRGKRQPTFSIKKFLAITSRVWRPQIETKIKRVYFTANITSFINLNIVKLKLHDNHLENRIQDYLAVSWSNDSECCMTIKIQGCQIELILKAPIIKQNDIVPLPKNTILKLH